MNQELTPATGSPAPQATAREFFTVVFRRKWLILGLFFATTGTVLAISYTTPLVYQSAGRVLVKRGEKESVLSQGRTFISQWEEELASEMEIVKSAPVIARAREILAADSTQRPPRLNPGKVDCEVMGKSSVMAIAYVDPDPLVAQRVAQAVIEAYIDFRQKGMQLAYPKRFFDSEIASLDSQLQALIEQRRSFISQEGVVDLVEQKRTQLSLLENLTQRRSEDAAALAQAQSEQRLMSEMAERPEIDNPTTSTTLGSQDPLMEIKRRIVEREAKLADLRERYRDDAIEVTTAESTLVTLKDMLRREVRARIEVSQMRVSGLQDRMRSEEKDMAEVQADLASMPEKEARLAELDREIGGLKRRYDDVVDKSGEARVTEYTSEPIKVLLLAAAGPAEPKTARDYVRLALAPAFSIVVGIGLAFFVDGLDLTVRTAGHAEEVLELPVLATVNERRRRRRA